MKRLLVCLFLLMASLPVLFSQQKVTVSGYIDDLESGERLIQCNVFDLINEKGTVTNNFGFFSLTVPKGKVLLSVSYVGYQTKVVELDLQENQLLNVSLSSAVELSEVQVVADSVRRIEEETQMSVVEIPIDQIKKLPALMGEVDVLKALQLLPGVQSGGEGQSGLYVRGGSPDQNLILLDGVPVYNSSHLFGFFSVFNADAIKDVKLIKGGFPARYGGRLSSVIDITMKDGAKDDFHGNVSIGLISSKLTGEGPIGENTTFLFSARRTYIDILARPLIQQGFRSNGTRGNLGYYFYDLNGKVTHRLSDKDRLYFSVYNGRDKFYFEEEDEEQGFQDKNSNDLTWGNTIVAARWNHLWNPKLFSNTTATFSRYGLGLFAGFESRDPESFSKTELQYDSGIRDYSLKMDFDYIPNTQHYIKFGAQTIYHQFIPGAFDLFLEESDANSKIDTVLGQKDQFAWEFATYIEDDFIVTDKLKINAGLHYSGFLTNGKTYSSLQPRLSLRYLLPGNIALKASYADMQQYVHLLAFDGIGLPADLWLPTTTRVRPQFSRQVALGLAKTIDRTYEVSLEFYYKTMDNVIAYKEGAGLFQLNNWEDRITQGDGTSYGMELFIQKKIGRWTGWLGYTLSWTDRRFPDLNRGERYPFKYDRRHDISVVGSYDLTDRIRMSATWVYGTGNAVTLAGSDYWTSYSSFGSGFAGTTPINYNSNKNNFRMSDFHRLDVGIDFIKKKEGYTRQWSVGAYNAYNRKNPFFLFYDDEIVNNNGTLERETVLKQASLFPIIPYVTWSIDF